MLELSLARNCRSTPPFPETSPSELEVWYEKDGSAGAFGCIRDGQHWMLLPEVASFCFDRISPEVKAFPYPLLGEDLVRDAYLRCVLPIAVQVQGREVLHASAVKHPQGVVVLCAVSEVGKSTIAYGLSRRGYSVCADDAVAFEAAKGRRSKVAPLPFSINLRASSAAYFGVEGRPHVTAEQSSGEPLPLAAIFVLKRAPDSPEPDEPIKCSRLSATDAFSTLLPHAYCFGLRDVERKRRMLQQYLLAAMHVPIFELCFPAGLEWLPSMLDEIEQAVGRLE